MAVRDSPRCLRAGPCAAPLLCYLAVPISFRLLLNTNAWLQISALPIVWEHRDHSLLFSTAGPSSWICWGSQKHRGTLLNICNSRSYHQEKLYWWHILVWAKCRTPSSAGHRRCNSLLMCSSLVGQPWHPCWTPTGLLLSREICSTTQDRGWRAAGSPCWHKSARKNELM